MVKRNQIIITALVVMIAVAGYLNYIDSNPTTPSEVVINDEGDLNSFVSDNYVDDEIKIASDEEQNNNSNLEAEQIQENANAAADSKDANAAIDSNNANAVADSNNANAVADSKSGETAADSKKPADEAGTAVFVNTSNDSSYFIQAKLDREQSRSKQKDILTEMINNSNIDKDKKSECANAMLEIQQRIEKETAAEAMIESKGFKEVYVRIDDETVDVVVDKESLTDAEIAQIEDIVKRKTGVTADKIRINPIKSE